MLWEHALRNAHVRDPVDHSRECVLTPWDVSGRSARILVLDDGLQLLPERPSVARISATVRASAYASSSPAREQDEAFNCTYEEDERGASAVGCTLERANN